MKRREFLSSAGAAALIPVLPLPAAAVPAAAAPVNTMQVGWAALYARVNNRATPALIQKWLRVGPEQAHALMSELVSRNIIHTPLAGSAAAVNPMYPQGGFPGMFNSSKKVVEKAKDVLDVILDDEGVEHPNPVVENDQDDASDLEVEDTPDETS